MPVTAISIRSGRANGYNRNILVRSYGESGAMSAYPTGDTVVVNYRNGKAKEYRLNDGVFLRNL
jgi:endonuclease YncB( thermonuclease family)